MLGTSDWKCAYLTAKLGGRKTWSKLPKEIETDEGKQIAERGGVPVHPVNSAVYGLARAGQDYSRHASTELAELGFMSARELIEQSPSQYFRCYNVKTLETEKDFFVKNRCATSGELALQGKVPAAGQGEGLVTLYI